MLKFELNNGKNLLRTTIGTIISVSLLTGCNTSSNIKSDSASTEAVKPIPEGFCYKGGRTNDYSCDPEKATDQADMRTAEIDEEWMKTKLAEVKKWIAEEKGAAHSGQLRPQAKPVITEDSREYITTVSVTKPAAASSSPAIEQSLKLSQQGNHQEALTQINAFLAQQPNLPSAQLTKGIILSNKGDKAAAKAIFQSLMKSHPDRPEAFNNLAVIYSEEGNFPQAIETLQQAFQTHPSYAQVHVNLKELYATLASQAYNKALDLNSAEQGPNLAMINQTPTIQGSPSNPMVVAAPQQPVKLAAVEKAKVDVQVIKPVIPKEQTPVATLTTITSDPESKIETPAKAKDKPVVVAVSEPTIVTAANAEAPAKEVAKIKEQTNAVPEAPKLETQVLPESEVLAHINNWADAWSNKNHAGYVNSYTALYRPNAKLNHQQWVKQRTQRLNKPKFIRVELNQINIKMLRDNLAEAHFNQHYQSDNYKDAVKKRLMLVKVDDQWKISLERSLGLLK
ncbi:tetratricopeptide repeat protein [Neptuniibacter sp. QD72_48]|uniref:tetratricopeptide repeat protein n=1 Tax=unclassified Neptuniibacter TaxID=2630693 RepID=UPI0039F70224